MLKALCLALALAGPTHAAISGVVDLRGGAVINLHSEAGPCTGGARRAEFIDPTKATPVLILGCWIVRENGVVSIGWLNGWFDVIPLSAIRPPKDA